MNRLLPASRLPVLKTRIILAVSGGLPLLACLFLLPPLGWQVLVLLVLLVTAWELLRLAGVSFAHPGTWWLALGPVALLLTGALLSPPALQWWCIQLACIAWLPALLWLTRPGFATALQGPARVLKIMLALLYILPALLVLTRLQQASAWLVLAFFTLIWSADVFAYFTGKAIGGPKLAPAISPGKTIAGLIGGMAGGLLAMLIWLYLARTTPFMPATAPIIILLVSAVLILISVGGDLLASLLKRHAGRKDSSQLLPGHGGLLDRLDSLLASAPFFAVFVHYLGLV